MSGEQLYGVNAAKAYGYVPPQNESQQYAAPASQGVTPPASVDIPPEVVEYLKQNIQAKALPSSDNFQKSEPGLGAAVATGLGVGAAAGGASYLFQTNPLDSNGIFKDSFLSRFDQKTRQMNVENFTSELISEAKVPTYTKLGIAGDEGYNAVKKLAQSAKLEDLADGVKASLPAGLTSPEEAKKLIAKAEAEFKTIDMTAIAKEAAEAADDRSINVLKGKIRDLKTLENKITSLADDIPAEDFKKFISNNKKLFKIEGTEDEIKRAVDTLAAKGKTRLLNEVKANAATGEKFLSLKKTLLNEGLMSYYDDAAKAFHESSPKYLQDILNSFKRNKALKTGGIAAAVTATALGLIFAVSKSAKKEQA